VGGVALTALHEIDVDHLAGHALEVERDADAERGERAPEGEEFHRRAPSYFAAPTCALRPAASMPATAQISSLSPVSPEMPTAPITAPPSRISTPPGDGTARPPLAPIKALTKAGALAARSASSRVPKPMPSAPHA